MMHAVTRTTLLRVSVLLLAALHLPLACAQHHGYRSSPATGQIAPPTPPPPPAPPPPIVAVSSGLGVIQFASANVSVPAPQALTRQLRFDDDRTREAALSSLGVPPQYLQPGRVPVPHSVELIFAQLGSNEEDDALLTVELNEHLVTAVLVPSDGSWRRVATLTFATTYVDPTTTPDSWLQISRSLLQREHYRAIFHGSGGSVRSGSFTENEAQLRIFGGRAVITESFVSTTRECSSVAAVATPPGSATGTRPGTLPDAHHHGGCSLTSRWFQAVPAAPETHFLLVTGTGHLSGADVVSPLMFEAAFQRSRLRTFSCQPFVFEESSGHFAPSAAATPCDGGR